MTLKTMPKVGDKVRYIGKCTSKVTYRVPYEIDRLSLAGNAIFYDDNGHHFYITGFELDEFELISEEPTNTSGYIHMDSYEMGYTEGKREVCLTVDEVGFASIQRLEAASNAQAERREIERQIAQLQRKLEALK